MYDPTSTHPVSHSLKCIVALDVCTVLAVSCGSHSSCVNSLDSEEGYSCVCDSGYRQDGNSCSSAGKSIIVLAIVCVCYCQHTHQKLLPFASKACVYSHDMV